MIKLHNINKSYCFGEQLQQVLYNVNLTIADNEMIAIMGASGSGKSTLMNLLGLLDHADSGDYFLKNEKIADVSDDDMAALRNHCFGFVFQQFHLLPRLSVLQNIALPLQYRAIDDDVITQHVKHQLEQVGMLEYINHKPNQLSGGQQQRVAIARALIGNPDIILADEPTGALDSRTGHDVMNIFHHLHKTQKKTVIIITHDKHIAQQCQRVVHIKDGRIREYHEVVSLHQTSVKESC